LWVKFGQDSKITRREYIDDIRKFYEIFLNKNNENLSVAFIDGKEQIELLYVTYEGKIECIKAIIQTFTLHVSQQIKSKRVLL